MRAAQKFVQLLDQAGLLQIWQVMQDCVRRGCATDGVLPGGFQVRRRAKALHLALTTSPEAELTDRGCHARAGSSCARRCNFNPGGAPS